MKIQAPGGILVMAVILAMAVFSLYIHPDKQRDFYGIYAGVAACSQGQNPYSLGPYTYPPYTLYLFRPLAWFDYDTAARIYLTLKLIAVAGLLYLWHRLIDLNQYRGLLWVLIPLAFSGTLLADLRTGNLSIFEQLLIWLGFYFYTRGRLVGFGIAIVAASLLKLTPILLLGLLAARWRKRELALGIVFGAAFFGLIAASAAVWPELFGSFLKTIHKLGGERGETDEASWALIGDVARWFEMKTRGHLPGMVPLGVYAMLVCSVLAVSTVLCRRLHFLGEKRADLWRICLICFVYALLVPRMKNYSFILLIVPSLFALTSSKWVHPALLLGGLLVIYNFRDFHVLGTALEPFFRVQGEYYCLMLAYVFFALSCCSVWRETAIRDGFVPR